MKVQVLLVCLIVGAAFAAQEEEHVRRKEEHVERHRGGERIGEEHGKEKVEVGRGRASAEELAAKKFKLDERTKEILLKEKVEKPHVVADKIAEFFLKNPNRQFERQCFAKFNPGESVDIVIDLAPSPSEDRTDKLSAQSPIAYYLDLKHQSPSRAYFNSIQMFIDAVTFDMKPEATHSIIYENKRKFFIRGKLIEQPVTHALGTEEVAEFADSKRNLKTMWPVSTKSIPDTFLHSVIKNNLGRMTKLALWNRDNGLPTVLAATRRSKSIYTIVISDGASGAKLNELTDDVSRTTVIDLGNRRFVKNIAWEDMRQLLGVVTLNAPQQLSTMVETCRLMSCRACGC